MAGEVVFSAEDKANLEALTEKIPRLKLIITEEIPEIKEIMEYFPKLVSLVSYIESLEETLEILNDKETMQAIEEGQKDIDEGRLYSWEEALKELGIDEKDL